MKPSHEQALIRLMIAISAFLAGGVVAEARIKHKVLSIATEEASAPAHSVPSSPVTPK